MHRVQHEFTRLTMHDISKPIRRVDNEEKLNGTAKYVGDIKYEGMLYAKTVRATIARGRIVNKYYPVLPKGYYIIDSKSVPGNNYVNNTDMPVFAENYVSYFGEPIALVVGPNISTVEEILEQIKIEYKILEPVYELRDCVLDYHIEKGDVENAFKTSDSIIKREYETGYQEHAYIEPQGVIGLYENRRVTIIGAVQSPFSIKRAVIEVLGCKEQKVRVKQAVTGGSFGGKDDFPSLLACQVAVAVYSIKKPVQLIYSREEDITYTSKRYPSKIQLEAAIKYNRIIGLRISIALNGGAYLGVSGTVLQRAMFAATGAYTINNVEVKGEVYKTNTVPSGYFRGSGSAQMIFAIEMFISHIAKSLHINQLEFREKHLAKQDDITVTNGKYHDPIIIDKMIEEAMEMSAYREKHNVYRVLNHGNPKSLKGIGMSLFVHGCGQMGIIESESIKPSVKMKKGKGDMVTIKIGAAEHGQGVETTMRKIAAHTLNKPIEKVQYEVPDTDCVSDCGQKASSSTTMIVGDLVVGASKNLLEKWNDKESFSVERRFRKPEYLNWDQEKLSGDAYITYSWGVNIIEVEINPQTYQVTVTGAWTVLDVGKAIDERLLKAQAEGGMLQGIGYGMLEVLSQTGGRFDQRNLIDYCIPTSFDSVKTEIKIMNNPFPFGPYGAKGASDITFVGAAPALSLAIEYAIGKEIHRLPVTPEYIMELMENGRN